VVAPRIRSATVSPRLFRNGRSEGVEASDLMHSVFRVGGKENNSLQNEGTFCCRWQDVTNGLIVWPITLLGNSKHNRFKLKNIEVWPCGAGKGSLWP